MQHDLDKPNGFVSSLVLIGVWGTILSVTCISLILKSVFIYLIAIFLIGTCQRYLEEMSHQATHRNLFSHRSLNDTLDILYSIPLFYTIKETRKEHFHHHSQLKEQQNKTNYSYDHLGISGKLIKHKWYRAFVIFIQPFLGTQALIEFKNIIMNTKVYFYQCYSYHLIILFILFYFHLESIYLYYWLVPYFTVFCVFYYYSELFTHFGCRNQFLSRDTSHFLVSLFIAPLGFCKHHSLHHAAPKLPWHNYSRVKIDHIKNSQSLAHTYLDMLNLGS